MSRTNRIRLDFMSPSIDQRENREFAAEIKFLVPLDLAGRLRNWARSQLAPDPHGSGEGDDGYRITSLYFDTRALDVFHRRGSFGRSKFRIRRYGQSAPVFLERKLKTRGLVSKRRTAIQDAELSCLRAEPADGPWPGRWFVERLALRQLAPVCQISYQRTARVTMTDQGPIRLTLDEDLRASLISRPAFSPVYGDRILEGHLILELKYRFQTPRLFKLLVEEFGLSQQPISKYRLAAAALGLAANQTPQSVVQPQPAPTACRLS